MLGYSATGWRKLCLKPVVFTEGNLIISCGTPYVLIGPICLQAAHFMHLKDQTVPKHTVIFMMALEVARPGFLKGLSSPRGINKI